jgi:hypothetical protein
MRSCAAINKVLIGGVASSPNTKPMNIEHRSEMIAVIDGDFSRTSVEPHVQNKRKPIRRRY